MFKAWNFIKKEALVQVFSCEFWEISKSTIFGKTISETDVEHLFKVHNNDTKTSPWTFCSIAFIVDLSSYFPKEFGHQNYSSQL